MKVTLSLENIKSLKNIRNQKSLLNSINWYSGLNGGLNGGLSGGLNGGLSRKKILIVCKVILKNI